MWGSLHSVDTCIVQCDVGLITQCGDLYSLLCDVGLITQCVDLYSILCNVVGLITQCGDLYTILCDDVEKRKSLLPLPGIEP